MSVFELIMKGFWKITEKSDEKNYAAQTEPEGIERVYDIPYIDDGNRLHLFDVYYPEKREGGLPAIIDIHGGGWMYGDKELNRMYCLNLAKRGFVVFNISYRLVPEVDVPDQLRDVMAALKFISDSMKDYPWDGRNIMLTGDSAGGMLASFAAALNSSEYLRQIFGTESPELDLNCLLLTSPVADMDVSGATGVYTKYMWGKFIKATPMGAYMNFTALIPHASFPPVMLVTSSGDFLAHDETLEQARRLENAGYDVELLDYPKFSGRSLPHVFAVLKADSPEGNMCNNAVTEFYRKHMK